MVFEPVSRRIFLRRSAAVDSGLAGRRAGATRVAASAPDLVARRVFFDNPDYINVRVRPGRSESRLGLRRSTRVNNLWIAPIADPGRRSAGDADHRAQSRQLLSLGAHQSPFDIFPRP